MMNTALSELQKKDLRHVWHPCSQMKDYEEFPPIVVRKGEGVYLEDVDGKRYLDAVSSWWTNLFGHCNKRIAAAVADQLTTLEQVIFANFSHEPAIELASRIAALMPGSLNRVFFADNGSSAVEVALKMSFHYHQQNGDAGRTRFVSLTDAYHGETLGALSVGDLDLYSKVYRPLLLDTLRVSGPDCFRCPYGKDRTNCSAECFAAMEETLAKEGETISAVIVEPLLQCAAGMKIYPPVYLEKLRAVTAKCGIHLIADEIATGFGRTGTMFAFEQANITPDFVTLSKGLTGGFLPLSLVVTTDEMFEAFYDDYASTKAFMHSHSYSGNPLSCRAAVETLNIFRDEDVLKNNAEKYSYMQLKASQLFSDHPKVGEYRQIGFVGAVELVSDKETKKGFDWRERVGYNIYRIALSKGVILRPLGNIIYFMPPYCISNDEIDVLLLAAKDSIDNYFKIKCR